MPTSINADQCPIADSGVIGGSRGGRSMFLLREKTPEQPAQRVCIVDDDKWVADALKSLLESFGFDVLSYNSGCEFLADGRRRSAGCLVIDQHMPGMNGLEVVDNLRKEGVRLPTILISGRLDAEILKRAVSLGVTEIVNKPFTAGRLVEVIRTSLSEHN